MRVASIVSGISLAVDGAEHQRRARLNQIPPPAFSSRRGASGPPFRCAPRHRLAHVVARKRQNPAFIAT